VVPGRITPRQASEQARAAARQRLREARETAGLSLRKLAAVMNEHGHEVGFAHLARVESGERSMTRDLVLAWGSATGQADPQAWAREVVEVLGQQRLGRSRQVLEMEFRPPRPAEVPDVLMAGDPSCRIRSPEAIYARAAGLLARAPQAAPGDDQPVVATTCGPLARAFREAAQSIAPSAIVPGGPDARKLVQLAAAPAPEERLRVVEEMLAASAVVPANGAAGSPPGQAREAREAQGLYEPLVAADASEADVIAVPGIGGAVVLSHPGGGCLWLPVPGDDYQALREYLDPALRQARSSPVIELFRAGRLVNQYWYKEWETKLLEQEEDAQERLFLQPHLGTHTQTPELAASRGRLEFRAGTRRVREQDIESWLGLRAERIAVFRRKLRQGGCRYRDIASVDTVTAMVADGYTHIRSIHQPADNDPGDKSERLDWVRQQLSNVRDLMTSYPGGYELRFVPADKIPASRLWSLIRKPGPQAEVLFTFTLADQASGQVPSPGGQGPWFANALVRDAEVSKRFREEFEQLWQEAPDRGHTLHVLQESIDKISAAS
jgi:transcriptional regulator with XRE-family HTH domain